MQMLRDAEMLRRFPYWWRTVAEAPPVDNYFDGQEYFAIDGTRTCDRQMRPLSSLSDQPHCTCSGPRDALKYAVIASRSCRVLGRAAIVRGDVGERAFRLNAATHSKHRESLRIN